MRTLPADLVDSAVRTLGKLWDAESETATSEYARKMMKDDLLDNLYRGDLASRPFCGSSSSTRFSTMTPS
jgi:hypothetical protein